MSYIKKCDYLRIRNTWEKYPKPNVYVIEFVPGWEVETMVFYNKKELEKFLKENKTILSVTHYKFSFSANNNRYDFYERITPYPYYK